MESRRAASAKPRKAKAKGKGKVKGKGKLPAADGSAKDDKQDYLSSMPEEILVRIIQAVDSVTALLRLSASCRQLRNLMADPFWQHIYVKYCPGAKYSPSFNLDFRSLVAIHHKQICGECQRFSPGWDRFPWYESAGKRLCQHCASDYGYTHDETSLLLSGVKSKKRRRVVGLYAYRLK